MALNPIEITGSVNRANDMYLMRNQNENKMFVDNTPMLHNVEKHVDDKSKKVVESDNADMFQEKFDAKEKGKNSYFSNRKENKKEDEKDKDGVVIVKNRGGFDISI